MAAIFVYIGVNLEPGLRKIAPSDSNVGSKLLKFGGSLKRLYRANPENESGECVTNRWGASPKRDDGMFSPAMNK